MHIPLAWHHLFHNKVRTTVAVVGVTFPIVLVFVQLGLYGSCLIGATQLYDALDFDLVLLAADYVSLGGSGAFPRSRLAQARAARGVQEVRPLYLGFQFWRNPDTASQREMLIIGCDPRGQTFRLADVTTRLEALQRPDTALIDRLTRPEFGPQHTGLITEVGGHRIAIVGQYMLGTGFLADGDIIVSDVTFARLFPSLPVQQVSLGLVQLAPGADLRMVIHALRQDLPNDVRVLSRAELEAAERQYWVQSTSIGILFGWGVLVGFAVEIVIPYQILSTDVTNRFPEYATLKAMGYSHGALARMVLQHALLLGGGGYLSGLGVALGMYRLVAATTHLPIGMDPVRGVWVGGVTLGLCVGAGLLALRKVRAADPAELF